jgi:hypothetical protein
VPVAVRLRGLLALVSVTVEESEVVIVLPVIWNPSAKLSRCCRERAHPTPYPLRFL